MSEAEGKIRLRPHHVLSYIAHVIAEEEEGGLLSLPDEKYLEWFRKGQGYVHSDKLVFHLRDTFRALYDNPDLKFKYVEGIDSICTECEHKKQCSNPETESYKATKIWDDFSIKKLPELEFGKEYSLNDLRKYMSRIEEANEEVKMYERAEILAEEILMDLKKS